MNITSSTPKTATPNSFHIRKVLALSAQVITIAGLAVSSIALGTPASAAPEEVWETRTVCDRTGCLIVSPALKDSDRDGVSDADEIAAGTDPHDPNSRPNLAVLVDLASVNELPSYAMTLGRFIVFPDPGTMMELFDTPALPQDLQGAFDSKSLENSLGKLGIKPEHSAGILGNGDILSVVNVKPTPKGSRPPGAKANYMELVAGEDPGKGNHPNGDGVILVVVDKDKGTTTEYWKDASGDIYREVVCKTGTSECTNSDDYTTGDESDVSVAPTEEMFQKVLVKIGSNSTPARIGGVEIDPGSVAEVVARNCESEVANTDGSEQSVCDGVGLYDGESGGIAVAPSPKIYNSADPRTVQNWNPPLTNVPGVNPLGGR
jgi:Bacterial TSP3 repeat